MKISGNYNRVEVIDHPDPDHDNRRRGRVWLEDNMVVRFSEQDDGRTLKIFLSEPSDQPYCPNCGSPEFKIGAPVSICGDCGWCE